jgi:hypothetical protein
MSNVFTIWHKFRPLGVSEIVTYRHMKFSSAGILEQSTVYTLILSFVNLIL